MTTRTDHAISRNAGRHRAAAISLIACVAGLWIAFHHPLSPVLAVTALLAWTFAAARWPTAWQLLLPGLLPVLGLAPWSGWLGVDEFDLAVLGAAAGGYAARALHAARADGAGADPIFDRTFAVVLGLSCVLSLALGWSQAEVLRFGWFDGYDTPLNALRVAKGMLWALLLLPLVGVARTGNGAPTGSVFAGGIVAGVVLAASAAVWERVAFTGLWNSDIYYRTSALFWEMHVGGAAIEVFLALGVPFVVAQLLQVNAPIGRVTGAALAALTAYACLSTLSRGLYVALAVALIPAAWLVAARRRSVSRESGRVLLVRVALAAFLVALGADLAQWLVQEFSYALAVATAALIWAVAAFCLKRWPRPRARRGRDIGSLAIALLLVVELGAVREGAAYVSRRLDFAADDLAGRAARWERAIAQLQSPLDWILGRGLGRFPVAPAPRPPVEELPGAFHIIEEGGNRFARIDGPASRRRMAGIFGITQRVGPLRGGEYAVSFDARSSRSLPLSLSLCEKHLIYEAGCASESVDVAPGAWRRYSLSIDAADLSGGPWFAPRPVLLSAAVNGVGGWVDIDNLRVVASDGRDLVVNGDFSADAARWLLTGRYFFLPWHADSLVVELLVERGILGLLIFGVLFARALSAWSSSRGRRDPLAPYHVAALAACLVLGLFSSVLDVPRNAFLLTMLCLLRPQSRASEHDAARAV